LIKDIYTVYSSGQNIVWKIGAPYIRVEGVVVPKINIIFND